MKINELLNVVDAGWIRKPKGFRVRFQTRAGAGWVTDTMPGQNENPLDSDVAAWRSAWKLWQAAKSGTGEYVNITVVDDRGEPFPSYITGRFDTYNSRPEASGAPLADAQPAGKAVNGERFVDTQPSAEEEAQASGDLDIK